MVILTKFFSLKSKWYRGTMVTEGHAHAVNMGRKNLLSQDDAHALHDASGVCTRARSSVVTVWYPIRPIPVSMEFFLTKIV